jgi:hypothetical protein
MSDSTPSARQLSRRRRANAPGGRHHKHEVKVTPEEEALLLQLAAAQGITIPRLLVEAALARDRGETLTERRDTLTELFRVRRLLAAVSNNVNQIARAVNSGETVGDELTHTLRAVRATSSDLDGVLRAAELTS